MCDHMFVDSHTLRQHIKKSNQHFLNPETTVLRNNEQNYTLIVIQNLKNYLYQIIVVILYYTNDSNSKL